MNAASATLPVLSLRDSAAATPAGRPAWRRRFRNDDEGGVVFVCSEGGCVSKRWTRERPHTAYRRWTGNTRGFDFFGLEDSFTRSGETARGSFWFGGIILRLDWEPLQERECEAELRGTHSQAELGNDTMLFLVLWGALSPFVLRVVAGACVGRGSGQPRMPPQERQHEGF